MLRVFIAECDYRRALTLGVLLVFPLLLIYSKYPFRSLSPHYLFFWSVFIVIQNLIVHRNIDKRERIFIGLPIARTTYGFFRTLQVLILGVVYTAVYALMFFLFRPVAMVDRRLCMTLCLVFWLIFSLYFTTRDVSLDFFRKMGITRGRFLLIMVMLGGLVQAMTLVAFLQASAHKPTNFIIGRTIDWILLHHPFQGEQGFIRFAVTTGLVALLSVWTFQKKKSYLG